jgi:outer membrane protein OmpA-like peptidoglycan-associated protein
MSRLRLLASLGLASCAALGLSRTARAEDLTGFAVNRFEPSEAGSRFFTTDTVDQSGKVRPAVRLTGDFGWHQLSLHDVKGDQAYVIGSQLAMHVAAGVTMANRYRLSLNAPIYLYQAGNDVERYDGRYVGASGGGLGDMRIGLDARVLGDPKGPFRLGLGFRIWAPTGDPAKYTGDGGVRLAPRLDASGDIGMFVYGASFGFMYRALHENFGTWAVGNELPFSAALAVKLLNDKLLVGPELQGSFAVTDNGTLYSKQSASLYGLLGAHYAVSDFRVGAAVGPGLSHATGVSNKALLTLEYMPAEKPAEPAKAAPKDRDKDGVLDQDDACPAVPGPRTADPKTNGCPPADRDKDGVVDAEDACPDVYGARTSDPKTNGCPPDRDHDGVLDPDDACPDLAGVKSDDPRTNGCPSDRDKDGIVDGEDACPDVPGPRADDPKTSGCPDTDKDGVVDPVDACPNDPGPKNDDPKKNGCPSVVVSGGQIKIFERVEFKTGSHEILAESDKILDEVAKTLKDHTEIKRVRVEGHTDNQGKAIENKNLSIRRANAVLNALAKRGIDRKRLESKGFGQEQPIDSNDTDVGRHNNRRVEFHIVGETAGDAAKPAAPTDAKPAPKADPKPAPKADAKPAPKGDAKPAPKADPKPAPKGDAKPAPKPAPKGDAKPAPKAAPKGDAKPAPKKK